MKVISRFVQLRFGLVYGMLLAITTTFSIQAQVIGNDDESRLYAQSKQVNQFFRRFNGEEDEKGNRFYPEDKNYRSLKLRKKYLTTLFDESNSEIGTNLKNEFAKSILDKPQTSVLDFHGPEWFSEVQTTFALNGKDIPITLFMVLEKDHLGSKWVIENIYTDAFKQAFLRDTTKVGRFLHPMSHEVDFMNLRKAFVNTDSISQFTSKKYVPDYLSVFLYEIKQGNLKFKSVNQVKFHFFQINGWYFELQNLNRAGYNTGWLISNLVKLNNDAEKNLVQKFLHYENH